ncbi:MAG: FBP domain-containing protein [Anaerolineae bacterium]
MVKAETILEQIKLTVKKKRIRIPGLQLTDEGILFALKFGDLTEDTLNRFQLVLEAYLAGQEIYGSHFQNVLLIRLIESFLIFGRSITQPKVEKTDLDLLARNTNEELFKRNLTAAEEPLAIFLGVVKPEEMASLFKWKTKTGKNRPIILPKEVEQGRFMPFTHISWTIEKRMYLVTKRDNQLMGLQLSFSPLRSTGSVPRMGLCDFCHGQHKLHETASITARIPTSKLPPYRNYKSVGRYVCIDHVDCNRKLYRSGKYDRIAQFIESVNENTPLIL